MKLILLLISFLSIQCLRIDNKLSNNKNNNLKGWETCSSCDAHNPKNYKQLLLEVDLFKDRIDFQFETMITNLSNKILNIENNIDISAKQSLDKIRESLLEIAIKIKSSLKQQLDDLGYIIRENLKDNKLKIKKISESLIKLGNISREFTANGIKSLETLELTLARDYKNELSNNTNEKPLELEFAEDFIIKSVPPKAIVKMLETFKLDMSIEGNKLIGVINSLKGLIS